MSSAKNPEFTEGSNVKGHLSVIAHEFQEAIVDVLVTKTLRAAKNSSARTIIVGGGVAANLELRRRMSDIGRKNKVNVFFPPKKKPFRTSSCGLSAAHQPALPFDHATTMIG